MKKLLYTLFAFAIIVACEKDMDDNYNVDSISPIEAQVSLSDSEILGIVNSILDLGPIKGSTRGNADLTSKGADRISMHIFLDNGQFYSTYVSEDNDDLCGPSTATALASVHLNRDETNNNIYVTLGEATTRLNTVPGDFSVLFSLPLNILLKLDSTNNYAVSGQGIFNDTNVATFADATTYAMTCAAAVDVSTFYNVTPAPFPLTGFLATIIDQGMFTGTSANYAGTTRAAVETAIEADINDGQ